MRPKEVGRPATVTCSGSLKRTPRTENRYAEASGWAGRTEAGAREVISAAAVGAKSTRMGSALVGRPSTTSRTSTVPGSLNHWLLRITFVHSLLDTLPPAVVGVVH